MKMKTQWTLWIALIFSLTIQPAKAIDSQDKPVLSDKMKPMGWMIGQWQGTNEAIKIKPLESGLGLTIDVRVQQTNMLTIIIYQSGNEYKSLGLYEDGAIQGNLKLVENGIEITESLEGQKYISSITLTKSNSMRRVVKHPEGLERIREYKKLN